MNAETKLPLIPLFRRVSAETQTLGGAPKELFRVMRRALQRYELYVRATKRGQKPFVLNIDDVTSDTLRDIWNFFENEYVYCKEYPRHIRVD